MQEDERRAFLSRLERTLKRLFLVLVLLAAVLTILVVMETRDISGALVTLAAMHSGLFFLIGLVAWIRMGDLGLVPTGRIFRHVLLVSFLGGMVWAVSVFYLGGQGVYIGVPGQGWEINAFQDAVGVVAAFLALTLATFLMQLAIICGAFGTIWFVGLLIRRLMPGVLKGVRLSTFGRGDSLTTRLMLWLMDIPDIVDASQLRVEVEPRRREFPWPRFARLVMWELFLGTILAVYISLNPVLLESLELVQVFSVLGTFSVVIPLVIIPWFVLLAIQASIPGVTRRFELFNGIRSRILQTFVALGTIVVFVRLALKDYDPGTILGSFLSYYVILGLISVYFAFVYLSFFETDLALEVEWRYRELG